MSAASEIANNSDAVLLQNCLLNDPNGDLLPVKRKFQANMASGENKIAFK